MVVIKAKSPGEFCLGAAERGLSACESRTSKVGSLWRRRDVERLVVAHASASINDSQQSGMSVMPLQHSPSTAYLRALVAQESRCLPPNTDLLALTS